jgi:bifunctional non-homologous end joining protein LigD
VSQFNRLLSRKAKPILYAFDLLWLNGEDLRALPLMVRKDRLWQLLRRTDNGRMLYAQHIEGAGKQFFQEVCERDLEGIVARRKHSIYRDDGTGWLKIKNKNYSHAEGRHELLTRSRGTYRG